MADTNTTVYTLGVGLKFFDVDSQKEKVGYIKLQNYKMNLTENQIKEAIMNLISGDKPILKDTYGNSFDTATAIHTAYVESQQTTEVDIGI